MQYCHWHLLYSCKYAIIIFIITGCILLYYVVYLLLTGNHNRLKWEYAKKGFEVIGEVHQNFSSWMDTT